MVSFCQVLLIIFCLQFSYLSCFTACPCLILLNLSIVITFDKQCKLWGFSFSDCSVLLSVSFCHSSLNFLLSLFSVSSVYAFSLRHLEIKLANSLKNLEMRVKLHKIWPVKCICFLVMSEVFFNGVDCKCDREMKYWLHIVLQETSLSHFWMLLQAHVIYCPFIMIFSVHFDFI